jgi:hypothetical protein
VVVSGERDRPPRTLPTVLNVEDLCRALRVSDDTVRTLIADGALQRLAYSNHRILVARDGVFRFLDAQTMRPDDAPPWRSWRDQPANAADTGNPS